MGNKKQAVVIDIRDSIYEELKTRERNLRWLSRKTEIPYATLYSMFVQKMFQISQDNLDKINEVLETKYTLPNE